MDHASPCIKLLYVYLILLNSKVYIFSFLYTIVYPLYIMHAKTLHHETQYISRVGQTFIT